MNLYWEAFVKYQRALSNNPQPRLTPDDESDTIAPFTNEFETRTENFSLLIDVDVVSLPGIAHF